MKQRYIKLWLPVILGANIITATAFVLTIQEKSRNAKAVILSLKQENATLKKSVALKDAENSMLSAFIQEQDKYIDTRLKTKKPKTGTKK